jgi:hypothetical protein
MFHLKFCGHSPGVQHWPYFGSALPSPLDAQINTIYSHFSFGDLVFSFMNLLWIITWLPLYWFRRVFNNALLFWEKNN